jgi:hypothetical protein
MSEDDHIHVVRGPTLVELDIAALGPTAPQQLLPERPNAGLACSVVLWKGHQDADPPHTFLLLRSRRDRPRSRAAEQSNETAALHVRPQAQEKVS